MDIGIHCVDEKGQGQCKMIMEKANDITKGEFNQSPYFALNSVIPIHATATTRALREFIMPKGIST